MPQIDTVDSTNGTPAASAARAACTSARGAIMPPSPTGARITGSASRWPSTSTAGSRDAHVAHHDLAQQHALEVGARSRACVASS